MHGLWLCGTKVIRRATFLPGTTCSDVEYLTPHTWCSSWSTKSRKASTMYKSNVFWIIILVIIHTLTRLKTEPMRERTQLMNRYLLHQNFYRCADITPHTYVICDMYDDEDAKAIGDDCGVYNYRCLMALTRRVCYCSSTQTGLGLIHAHAIPTSNGKCNPGTILGVNGTMCQVKVQAFIRS